ncbi:hypothetical protein IAT38_008256 [Cryptococcus sp. DSM 104549]
MSLPHNLPPCPTPFIDRALTAGDGLELPIRIFPAQDDGSGKPRPWLFWVHGGGYIGGKHYHPTPWLVPALRSQLHYHIVSASYRLLPNTFPSMISDLHASFSWARSHLPELLRAGGYAGVELDAYAVGGDSAGGHLALILGAPSGPGGLTPPPRAVLDVYGVADPTDPWFTRVGPPMSAPFNTPAETIQAFIHAGPEDKVRKAVTAAWDVELPPNMTAEQLKLWWGAEYAAGEEDTVRLDTCTWLSEHGGIIALLFNKQGLSEDAHKAELVKWAPLHAGIPESAGARYPPTIILHGSEDALIQQEQSRKLAGKLKGMGTEVGEVWVEGAGHAYDAVIFSPESPGWDESVVPVMNFLETHIGGAATPSTKA